MPLPAPLTPFQVAHAFHHDQVYLFVGAACITFGIIPAIIALVRRRRDALSLWLSTFAILYGVRLWMNHQLAAILPHSLLFTRLYSAIAFLVPIPAFFFFQKARLFGSPARFVTRFLSPLLVILAILSLLGGRYLLLHALNNIVVIIALLTLAAAIVRSSSTDSRDLHLLRRGLFIFLAGALFDNIAAFFGRFYNVEPFAFLVFLFCLGLVAARQSFARETKLTLVQQELDIARNIQLSILPPPFPPSANFSIAARYLPMTTVAGDFYDFLLTGHPQTALLIADVSGHGIPAALIASMVKLAAASNRALAHDPAALLHAMNIALCGNTQSQFVTAACVYLDPVAHRLRYAAAAHPPMLILRAGTVQPVVENGLMLAAFPSASYTSVTCPILPGDRILLYTDGLLEAAGASAEEFGPTRLAALLANTAPHPAASAADHIIQQIRQWAPVQTDDLTVIVCDFLG